MTVIHVMENEDEVIEACPFCACGGATLSVYQQGVQKFFVGCDNCGAEGRRGFSIRESIEIWNRVAGVPLDDLESVIARYTFQVERGKDEALDRVMAWLNKVKPLETDL